MPSVSGTVTSARSGRDRPCASLPRTIMPADSIGASASGAPLGGHGLGRRTKRSSRESDPRIGSKRQLVPLADCDQLELQAGRPGFREHARTLQEDEPWLAPVSKTPQSADDLVVRAAD